MVKKKKIWNKMNIEISSCRTPEYTYMSHQKICFYNVIIMDYMMEEMYLDIWGDALFTPIKMVLAENRDWV